MPHAALERATFANRVARLIAVVQRRDPDHVTDDVLLAEVGIAICEARFGGRGGSSEYKVLTAAWRIAVEAKTCEPTLPLRRLTGEAGIGSRETTAGAIDRLVDTGWLSKVEHTDGRRGNRYRLGTPNVLDESARKPGPIAFTLGTPRDGTAHGKGVSGRVLEDSWLIKHDAFAYKALGSSAARLYIQLTTAPRTRRELAELTGLGRDTVRRNLQRLVDHDLAVGVGDRWCARPFSLELLDSIASRFGTAGRHAAQARRHEEERRHNLMRQLDSIAGNKTDPKDWHFDEEGLLINRKTGEMPDVYGQVWPARPTTPGPVAALSPIVRRWYAKRRLGASTGGRSALEG